MKNRDDLAAIAAEVSTPIILGSASREMMDREWLSSIGVRVCLQGHKVHAVAMEAFLRAQTALANGTHPDDLENVASGDTMKRLMRAEDYDRWREEYL